MTTSDIKELASKYDVADTNQERVGSSTDDCGTLGTTTESAVYGVIADYENKKITIIGIGRGNSRVISLS